MAQTNPWRSVCYGRDHTKFGTTVELIRHLWKQDPEADLKLIAKKAKCTLALVYYATKDQRHPTWRRTRLGAQWFRSRSDKVRYMLTHTKLSQTEIAKECNVSPPRVCQLASEIKK